MRPKFLLILSLVLMLMPSILYWVGPLRRPAMADGDRLEMLACPVCSGSGQSEQKPCSRCRGKKKVQFVVPGPHRPTYLEGHVYAPDGQSIVPEAQVTFSSSMGDWTRKTDDQGRFGADLPPGKYPLKISSSLGKLETVVEIQTQTEPTAVDLDLRFPQRRDRFILNK